MRKAIREKVFPGGVLLVKKEDSIVFFEPYGFANIFTGRRVSRDTVFDLASLTKPLATALAAMLLFQRGRLDLDEKLENILPQFKKTGKSGVTVEHLLTHRSGYPAYRPYYKKIRGDCADIRRKFLRRLLADERLVHPIGKRVYSDLGFMTLAWVLETIAGHRLDCFVTREIYKPLGLGNIFFSDAGKGVCDGDFAATEFCPWRNTLTEGVVHDENAYAAGGVEGHAGLFGGALDICGLLTWLESVYYQDCPLGILRRDVVRVFLDRTDGKDGTLGFDTPSMPHSSSGRFFGEKTVGHLGFTGVSFWMDLQKRITVILLTNRVHPSRLNNKIKEFRPKIHNAVMKRLL